MNAEPTNTPARLPASPDKPSRPTAVGEPVSAYTWTYSPTRENCEPIAETTAPDHSSRNWRVRSGRTSIASRRSHRIAAAYRRRRSRLLRECRGDRVLEHVEPVGQQRLVDVARRQEPHDIAVGPRRGHEHALREGLCRDRPH